MVEAVASWDSCRTVHSAELTAIHEPDTGEMQTMTPHGCLRVQEIVNRSPGALKSQSYRGFVKWN